MATQQSPFMSSLVKSMGVLDHLIIERSNSAEEGIPLSKLSKDLALPLNSLHTILKTLVQCGYAKQVKRGMYAVGPKIEILINASANSPNFEELLSELLSRYALLQGETHLYANLVSGRRHMVKVVQGPKAIGVDLQVLAKRSFYNKATARVLCSYLNDVELQKVIDLNGLPHEHWGNIDQLEKFKPHTTKIREQGYAQVIIDDQDVIAIAAPVLDAQQNILGSIGSYAPMFRMQGERVRSWIDNLKSAAREMEQLFAEK